MRSSRFALFVIVSAVASLPSRARAVSTSASPASSSFSYSLKASAMTSAGIYDDQGHLVKVLWTLQSQSAGEHAGKWDGKDDFGAAAPPGNYHFLVIANRGAYRNVGAIGNDGQPPDASGHAPVDMESVAVDSAGAVYSANGWDEAGADFKKWDASGRSVYDANYQIRNGDPNGEPYSIATDGQFIYCGVSGWSSAPWNEKQQIQRFRLSDGKAAPFTQTGRTDGHINVWEWPSRRIPPDAPASDAEMLKHPLRALAIRGGLIYATDALGGRILKYNKVTGMPMGEFPAKLPQAIAISPNGEIWVGGEHHLVSRFTDAGKPLGEALSDVGDVRSLAFGPDGLYVADGGAGQVKIYRLDGEKPTLARTIGRKAQPGDGAPDRFFQLNGAAVDAKGNVFTVQDEPMSGARLAKWSPDGKLVWERCGREFVSLGNYGAGQPDRFISMSFHLYRLKSRGAGEWEALANAFSGGPKRTVEPHGAPRILRLGKADFYFYPSGDGVQIFRIDPATLHLAALIGGREPGPFGVKTDQPGQWTWSDIKGSGDPKPEEIRWFKKPGEGSYHVFGMQVDDKGNVWYADFANHGIWEIPLGPLDAKGNPTYDWAKARQVIPPDASPLKFQPAIAQHGDDGSIASFGWSDPWPSPKDNPFWMGGTTLVRWDASGRRTWAVRLPEICVGLDRIPGGGFMVGGAKSARIYHYSPEGLLIGTMAPGPRMGGVSGWLDNQASVAVSRDPRDRILDVYAEDDYALRIAWHRADDGKIERIEGKAARL